MKAEVPVIPCPERFKYAPLLRVYILFIYAQYSLILITVQSRGIMYCIEFSRVYQSFYVLKVSTYRKILVLSSIVPVCDLCLGTQHYTVEQIRWVFDDNLRMIFVSSQ